MKDTAARITQARTGLILDHPFFGALALRLAMVPDATIKTASTDGRAIRYNPEFFDSLTDAEIKGVLAHVVLHCTNGHPWRMGDRDPKRWNVAADMAVNPLLKESRLILPAGGLDTPPDLIGKSVEAIYNALPEGNDGGQGGNGKPQPGPGEVEAPAPGTQEADQAADLEAEWKAAAMQSAKAAAMQGMLPGSLARMVEELKRPRVDWKAELRRFIQQTARNDYAWTRQAARYLHAGLYLPGLKSETMPPLVVAVDTSGSIDAGTLVAFGAEIQSIMDETRPEALHIIYCDSSINKTQTHEPGDLIRLEAVGGGGTSFLPPFAWVDAEGIQPAALIYLTDLEGPAPAQAPDYPVMWACTTRKAAPWGQTISLED